MKLIIAGGRNYSFTMDDYRFLADILPEITEVVTGGARGADEHGKAWAIHYGLPHKEFPAKWIRHGKRAGPIRNAEMAEYADAVVLFPGGKGTDDMHNQAVRSGIVIYDRRHIDG